MSPAIFITYLERVMDACEDCRTGVSISGELIDNLRFADDIDPWKNGGRLYRKV